MSERVALIASLGLLFAAVTATPAADGAPGAVRPRNDVRCTMTVKDGAAVGAGTAADVTVVVRNRSRRGARTVTMAIYADAPTGTPLWSEIVRVGARHRRTRRLSVDVPQTATSLIAVAECDPDDDPGNNMSNVTVVGGTAPGGGGEPPPPPVDPAILAGAATYSMHCAVCHTPDGTGSRSGPRILDRSANEIYQAFRDGPGRMPQFLSLTRTDAEQIARFLEDPGVVFKSSGGR